MYLKNFSLYLLPYKYNFQRSTFYMIANNEIDIIDVEILMIKFYNRKKVPSVTENIKKIFLKSEIPCLWEIKVLT